MDWKGENAGYKDILSIKTRDKNHKAERHIDGRNVGVSYIIGLGNYSGGELIVYDENEKSSKT
tara:strand:+ start:191 stop:379 length:189 start_codon:yes stop_codon:yes gene_type:complete